jgi:hypothetical protein
VYAEAETIKSFLLLFFKKEVLAYGTGICAAAMNAS